MVYCSCCLIASLFFLVALSNSRRLEYKTYIVPDRNPFFRPAKLQGFSSSSKQPSRCTSDDLPCYDAILTFIRDGNCDGFTLSDPNFLFQHYAKVGQGKEAIIAAGKKAADFIFKQTGFDFSNLPDEAYLAAEVSTRDGSVIFRPGHFTPACRYRLTALEVGGKVQFVNRLASTAGWTIRFTKETRIFGELNTVIPANTSIAYGSYVILPCEKGRDKNCQSLYNPRNPYAPIFIQWNSITWVGTFQPGPFTNLDQDLFSEEFGTGRGIGIVYNNEKGQNGVQVLTFPPTIDDDIHK